MTQRATCNMSDYYSVERIVASRKKVNPVDSTCCNQIFVQGKKHEFLVLWQDYPKEEASWVCQNSVTPDLLRYATY